MLDEAPFEDVVPLADGFSIPELKFRELVFIGALRPQGEAYVLDSARPLPAFREAGLFPAGAVFHARRVGGRVELRPKRG